MEKIQHKCSVIIKFILLIYILIYNVFLPQLGFTLSSLTKTAYGQKKKLGIDQED
jgi:hypothetical protein